MAVKTCGGRCSPEKAPNKSGLGPDRRVHKLLTNSLLTTPPKNVIVLLEREVIKMTDIEKLANEIMTECEKNGEPVTPDEAISMACMELKEKENRRYEKSDTPRKKVVRERKVDPDKLFLIGGLDDCLCDMADNVEERKNESEIHFTYNDCKYTLKLIKHRAPK